LIVLVEGQGEEGYNAVPVTKEVYQWYFDRSKRMLDKRLFKSHKKAVSFFGVDISWASGNMYTFQREQLCFLRSFSVQKAFHCFRRVNGNDDRSVLYADRKQKNAWFRLSQGECRWDWI
jgi:hypothetical protein